MKFIIDGRLDIRPLASEDSPATPLPYDDITLLDVTTWQNMDNTDNINAEFATVADWGSGLDFYPSQIIILIEAATDFLNVANDGISIDIFINETGEYLFRGQYEGSLDNALQQGGSLWTFARTIDLPLLRKVLATQTIQISITNGTSEDGLDLEIYISGIAK